MSNLAEHFTTYILLDNHPLKNVNVRGQRLRSGKSNYYPVPAPKLGLRIKTVTSVFSRIPFCYFHLFALFFFSFLWPHPRHMEVSRLGVEVELQLPAYVKATATPDPSHICDLHHSSQQCQIL